MEGDEPPYTPPIPTYDVPAEVLDPRWITDRVNEALHADGSAPVQVRSIETERREHSVLHDCTLDDGQRLVVKVGLHWQPADAAAVLRHARELRRRGDGKLRLPEHLAWSPAPPTIVMRHVAAPTLNSRLREAARSGDVEAAIHDVAAYGRALGAYHHATLDLALPVQRRAARRADLAAASLLTHDPRVARPGHVAVVKAVRDLHFDNVLVDEHGALLLDLWPRPFFRSAHRDLGAARHKLRRLALRVPLPVRDTWTTATWRGLLVGYTEHGPLGRWHPADEDLARVWLTVRSWHDAWRAARARRYRLAAGRARRSFGASTNS